MSPGNLLLLYLFLLRLTTSFFTINHDMSNNLYFLKYTVQSFKCFLALGKCQFIQFIAFYPSNFYLQYEKTARVFVNKASLELEGKSFLGQ